VLQPKRVKYRKVSRGHLRGKAHSGNTVAFGEYGLQSEEACWITARQIEAARRVMVRYLRRGGKMWIRIYPDKPITKKPAETRQGGGKGSPEEWVAVVRPGRMLFEMSGIKEEQAKEAMHLAAYKLPISTRFVLRAGGEI
jgi:large subunit ribosomal protein L16